MVDAWNKAKSPNYETNKDKLYPYSELPFLSGYQILKIPLHITNLVEHVDYFGVGRKNLTTGIIGFPDCYNVNYEYRLVDEGPDVGRKIPNRIPISETQNIGFSTRIYIKDNSVHTVTVNLQKEGVTDKIAQDIVRIVNSGRGKVIVYGYNEYSIERICDELRKNKHLFYCPIYVLPDKLQLTYWKNSYRAYLGVKELKRELCLYVYKGDFEAAVILTGCLTDTFCGGAIGDVVNHLLEDHVRNVIAYGYKLWNSNHEEVVREHFPSVFHHIFNGDRMAIINERNNQALILEPKTTKDGNYKSSQKVGWKIITIWDDKNVFFKLYNIDSGNYLQLSPTAREDGVREAGGKINSEEQRDDNEKFSFSPVIMENGQVAFHIFNYEGNKQLLELPVDVNSSEVTAVVGHRSVCSVQDGQSRWILTVLDETAKKGEQSKGEDFSNIYDYD